MPFFEIGVGGGDDAGINGDGLASADPLDALLLEEAEKFDLQREGNFADFIQEKRAADGGFKASFALGVGAGEGAFFVPEQFAFQKRFRDGAAVDGDKRPLFAGAALVDGLRRHFLAGSALAQEKHGGVGRGHFADGVKDAAHGGAGAEHALESVGGASCCIWRISLSSCATWKARSWRPV